MGSRPSLTEGIVPWHHSASKMHAMGVMNTQVKTLLIILKNLGSVLQYRAYVPKIKALGYQHSLEDPCYSRSPVLATLHFQRYGAAEILRGDRVLNFTVAGETYRYREDVYLFLNPDVAEQVALGRLANGLSHFVLSGYDEMLSGNRKSYLDRAIQPMMESGVAAIEQGRHRLAVKVGGLEYDYIPELYIKSYPEATLGTSPLRHFVTVTLTKVEQGTCTLYKEDYSSTVEKIVEGKSKNGRNLCIFAHFDPEGVIDPHVVRYLEGLKTMDCEIVFVSRSVKESECAKILPFCSEIILRTRYGRDFDSWYLGVKHCRSRFEKYGHVIWASDAVYFPLLPAEDLIAKMERMKFDVWAIHESWTSPPFMPSDILEYHLECFFLGFANTAVRAGILDEFVERYEQNPVQSQIGQVYRFEHWIAARAMALNMRVGALCKVDDQPQIDPPIDLWRQSLAWYGAPTLKVELASYNPHGNFSFDHLDVMIDQDFYDPNLIRRHSARMATGVNPTAIQPVEVKLAKRIDRSPFVFTDTLCVFSHFDAKGLVRPYVLRFLQALEEVGCEFIFITSSTKQEELAKLPESCRRIIQKTPESEHARDIGAYWLALQDLRPDDLKFKRYLLSNDSVFFPLTDHKRMFAEMGAKDYDLWSTVECIQLRWHVQSYFWNFSPKCFIESFLPAFLDDYSFESARWDMIRNYETRYPNLIRDAGYKVGSYVPIAEVGPALIRRNQRESPGKPIPKCWETLYFNPHWEAWDLIISEFNCPSAKIGCLRHNGGAKSLRKLEKMLQGSPYYDYALIADVFGDVTEV